MTLIATWLKTELEKKQKKNPLFSMRSFARLLNLSPSVLSKIMNGQTFFDLKKIKHALVLLETPESTKKKIIEEVSLSKKINQFKMRKVKQKFSLLNHRVFEIIANPNHYALLELIKLNEGKFDLDFFALKLSLSKEKIELLIENLQAVKLIKIKDDRIVDLTQGFSTHEIGPQETNRANKLFQQQIIQKSILSLEYDDICERSHSSIVFATHSSKILEATEIIKKFRQSLCAHLEDHPIKDSVYALQIGFFPMVKGEAQARIDTESLTSNY
ncbi:MAG: TIGR02147 family protein [Bacteriovoracaceae bacterium]|nr:TIGR02147 family protein [Bacteriovoracaceae bacterium]